MITESRQDTSEAQLSSIHAVLVQSSLDGFDSGRRIIQLTHYQSHQGRGSKNIHLVIIILINMYLIFR